MREEYSKGSHIEESRVALFLAMPTLGASNQSGLPLNYISLTITLPDLLVRSSLDFNDTEHQI